PEAEAEPETLAFSEADAFADSHRDAHRCAERGSFTWTVALSGNVRRAHATHGGGSAQHGKGPERRRFKVQNRVQSALGRVGALPDRHEELDALYRAPGEGPGAQSHGLRTLPGFRSGKHRIQLQRGPDDATRQSQERRGSEGRFDAPLPVRNPENC